MAVLIIEFDNLTNGQEIVLPYEVTGEIKAPPGAPGNLTLSAAARQIDDNALVNLPAQTNTPLPFAFTTEITVAECPDADAWYMLTIYGWDSQGDCTLQSVSFKRMAEVVAPPLPPPPCLPNL